jgi:hypothetical protein
VAPELLLPNRFLGVRINDGTLELPGGDLLRKEEIDLKVGSIL